MSEQEVVFIADFYASDINGGAELVNQSLIELLKNDKRKVSCLYSRYVTVKLLRSLSGKPIILGSFVHLSQEAMNELASNSYNYTIYEHDHKYLANRNPAQYQNFKAPDEAIINKDFYTSASVVLCQSRQHEEIVKSNLSLTNTINLGSSLWSEDYLNTVEQLQINKTKVAAIIASSNPIKNQAEAEQYCKQNNIEYEVVSSPTPLGLTRILSEYEYVVLLPTVPESLCRVAVEAKMVGCKIITNNLLGAASEDWFSKSRQEIISEMKKAPLKTLRCVASHLVSGEKQKEETHFKIVIPFYNAEKWIGKCIDSVKEQSYSNYECIIINDASTDNSNEVVLSHIQGNNKFRLIENKKNVGALENIYNAVKVANPSDDDVITALDGDDWLMNNHVLNLVNHYYQTTDCWLTYGSYVEYPSGQPGKFSKKTVDKTTILQGDYRRKEWMTSALRTFKFNLWKRIAEKDLKTSDGSFYSAAWDLAFMFPMLEMAGEKIEHLKELVYVYNLDNPINDHKVTEKRRRQLTYEAEIRAKEKYNRIDITLKNIEVTNPDHFVIQDPKRLLTSNRFDITAKTMYVRHYDKQVHQAWAMKVYDEHIKVWGNYTEKNPPKKGIEEFYSAFHKTMKSIKEEGFKEGKSVLPVTEDISLLNGSHRAAISIVNKQPVICKVSDISSGQYDCSQKYFSSKADVVEGGLGEEYTDSMTVEYARLKKNIFVATLYQHCHQHVENIENIIKRNNVQIVSTKKTRFTETGKLNYILSLYGDESWIGNETNNFPGAYHQSSLSFAKGPEVIIMLLESDNIDDVVASKEETRKLIGVGKPSIHITDTYEEAWNNVTTAFSANSLEFVNKANVGATYNNKFKTFLKETNDFLEENSLDKEDICIVGSAPLAAYGVRPCRDFDILHPDDSNLSFTENVGSHNSYVNYYSSSKNEIIYNHNKHFYVKGLKIITLDGSIDMKRKRGEAKDVNDSLLAARFLG
jgi:glycosyltransferase involved in cell wall biosynthesis